MNPSKSLTFFKFSTVFFMTVACLLVFQQMAISGEKIWEDGGRDHEPYIDPAINKAMSELVKGTLPAVVSIATEQVVRPFGHHQERMEDLFEFFFNQPFNREFKQQGLGSGFIINEDGHILTNNHVIERADEITVTLAGGEQFPAQVIGRDERTDIALIKMNTGKKLPYLKLGDSSALEIGETVVAMGNPLGLSHTVTQGIVSQKGRKDINPSGRQIYANFIQTDASINPGNSGGPLLNIYGEVVGINTAIARGQGIGFAIPISMAKTLLPQLVTGKVERSWIGIRVQEVTKPLADSLGLDSTKGALIAEVVEDSPASKAGLKAEDVIIEFNGKPVKTASDLTWFASTAGVGKNVRLKIWRSGRTKNVTLTLGLLPGQKALSMGKEKDNEDSSAVSAMGVTVAEPNDQQRRKAGLSDNYGVIVTKVDPDSNAAHAGVRPGDIIRKINSTLIKDVGHFGQVARKLGKGKSVRLFINRNQIALFIAFRIDE